MKSENSIKGIVKREAERAFFGAAVFHRSTARRMGLAVAKAVVEECASVAERFEWLMRTRWVTDSGKSQSREIAKLIRALAVPVAAKDCSCGQKPRPSTSCPIHSAVAAKEKP